MKHWLPVFLSIFSISCSNSTESAISILSSVDISVPLEITESLNCPDSMTEINGMYCPKVKQMCLDWLDDETLPYARCRLYKQPSECLSDKIEMNYCIDTYEMHDNFDVPYGNKSWRECKAACEHYGKRLCIEPEWNFACEGEEMLPYLYGYEFSTTICNVERKNLVCGNKICDYRAKITEFPECKSWAGVYGMIGNTDEWILTPIHYSTQVPGLSMRSGLKGGHFGGGRHRCRPMTSDHDESFINPPTLGCRCCSDIK